MPWSFVVFDFAIMPVVFEVNDNYSSSALIADINKLQSAEVQVAAINALTQRRTWQPLTVQGGGLFHVAFGAILGIAAWTRGQEKVEFAKRGEFMS